NGLLPAEAITAATVNAAHAIGRERDLGSVESGKLADLLILDIPSWRHLGYRLGGNAVETVVKRGRVFDRRRLADWSRGRESAGRTSVRCRLTVAARTPSRSRAASPRGRSCPPR